MKIYLKNILIFLFAVCIQKNYAQEIKEEKKVERVRSFDKNINVIALGVDAGVYVYRSVYKTNNTKDTSGALNRTFSLQYERGILKWLGVGAKFGYSNYYSEVDSVTGTKPTFRAFDVSLLVNAHFIRAKYVDMFGGFNIGYSNLTYNARDQYVSGAQGGGVVFDLHIQPRFYFGKYVGVFLNLAYIHYSYPSIDFQNTYTRQSDALDLRGGGVNLGIGIQGRF